MMFQIRLMAVLRSVNFFTGLRLAKGPGSPAMLFQISMNRPVGQSLLAAASSF